MAGKPQEGMIPARTAHLRSTRCLETGARGWGPWGVRAAGQTTSQTSGTRSTFRPETAIATSITTTIIRIYEASFPDGGIRRQSFVMYERRKHTRCAQGLPPATCLERVPRLRTGRGTPGALWTSAFQEMMLRAGEGGTGEGGTERGPRRLQRDPSRPWQSSVLLSACL